MELETGARKYLLTVAAVTAYVGDRVWKVQPREMVDGTGRRALVVRRGGQWSPPDPGSTIEYPTLEVECWADCSRDAGGKMTTDDAVDNAWALYRVTEAALHLRTRDHRWGDVVVLDCKRWTEPTLVPASAQKDIVNAAMVMARFACQIVPSVAIPASATS